MSEHRQISYGRGGAGNMYTPRTTNKPDPSTPRPEDLVTPTLKADIYTTGRGGTGNMVTNDDPEIARVSQDVDAPPPVTRGSADEGVFLTGRGGAANIHRVNSRGEEIAEHPHDRRHHDHSHNHHGMFRARTVDEQHQRKLARDQEKEKEKDKSDSHGSEKGRKSSSSSGGWRILERAVSASDSNR